MMRHKSLLLCIAFLIITSLTACSSKGFLNESESKAIIEKVKTLETSEYDLVYFRINYEDYILQLNDIVDDLYLDAMSDEILFGYADVKYTKKDVAGMSVSEWENHKEHMLSIINATGFDTVKVMIQFSNLFESEQDNQLFLYTIENKELKNKPLTTTTKRYTLNLIGNQWLVTEVERDTFTHGSNEALELKYQTHADQPIIYNEEVLILQ